MLYPADWSKGKGEGFRRNTLIIKDADIVLRSGMAAAMALWIRSRRAGSWARKSWSQFHSLL
jgi:hypothetical protein